MVLLGWFGQMLARVAALLGHCSRLNAEHIT
jgi:hypothetical protein